MKNLYAAILSLGLTVACTATPTETADIPATPPVAETETVTPPAPEAPNDPVVIAEAAPDVEIAPPAPAPAPEPPTAPDPESDPQPEPEPEPELLEIEVDWAALPQAADWTAHTANAVDEFGSGLIESSPTDIAGFCPNYETLNDDAKRAFWVSLISAMARPESNFNPDVSFNEYDNCKYPGCKDDFTTRDGRKVVSRGLLQLSQESANGYQRFGCSIAIEDEEALHDPETNLRCGVVILSRWVSRDGLIAKDTTPYRGGARYWSVLRRPAKISGIQGFTANTSYCAGG